MDREQALEAARSIAVVAAEHGDETERDRRLAPPVAAAIEASGLNRLMSPREIGGFAASPVTMCEVVEEISRGDASTGWCLGIGIGSNFLSGLVTEAAAKEAFTDLDKGAAGPFAPTGRAEVAGDGYRVGGRWPYSSNCTHASVAAVGVIAFDGGKPVSIEPSGMPKFELAMLTRDQYDIDETWNTVGMRGTGSHDIIATDAEISRERTCTLFDEAWPDDALFRLRSFDVLGPCLGMVPVGIGRAALDVVATKAVVDAAGPPVMGPRPKFGDDPHGQLEFARAEMRLRAARAMLLEALENSYTCALEGDTPARAATAVIGMAIYEIFHAADFAVSTAIGLLGSAAIRDGAPLDRLRRDLDTAGTHIMLRPGIQANLARELAGIPTFAFPFLPPPPE